jgi:hypothetical protein
MPTFRLIFDFLKLQYIAADDTTLKSPQRFDSDMTVFVMYSLCRVVASIASHAGYVIEKEPIS